MAADGTVDFSKARTAELILKGHHRSLGQTEQESRLVDRAAAESAFFDEGRTIRHSAPANEEGPWR